MKKQFPMIVKFVVKENKVKFVKSELLKLLEPTRKEKGCVQYDLHQDLENPSIFMFYEIWETKELWLEHDTNPNVINFVKTIEDSVYKITHNKLTLL